VLRPGGRREPRAPASRKQTLNFLTTFLKNLATFCKMLGKIVNGTTIFKNIVTFLKNVGQMLEGASQKLRKILSNIFKTMFQYFTKC
jgi:hypothetical protein